MKKIILAFDSFKGCMSAEDACSAAANGIHSAWPEAEIVALPMSDGGEGLVKCVEKSLHTKFRSIFVTGPITDKVEATYTIDINSNTAYMEMAAASGLMLVSENKRNPMVTTTYGVGEMIADAISKGCKNIVMGIGGSATCDGGKGMVEALRDCGLINSDIIKGIKFVVACDVDNPLYGKNGAAYVFAPQKGATAAEVKILDKRLRIFAHETECLGLATSEAALKPGTGAAGGLGYALYTYLKAELKAGIEIMLDIANFDNTIAKADLVVTGEGKSDIQTMMGKVAQGVMKRAKKNNVPIWLLSGAIDDKEGVLTANFNLVKSINDGDSRPLPILLQRATAMKNIEKTISQLCLNLPI